MNYKEFKKTCIEKLKEKYRTENFSSEFLFRFKKEIEKAEYYYLDGIDLFEEMKKRKPLNRYVLPYILGINKDYDLSKKLQLVQIKEGDSGGIDVDSDFEGSGRDSIIAYLKNKYGEDCVFPVGTLSMLGLKSSIKDLLKYYGAPFKESNDFTSALNDDLTFEENIESFRVANRQMFEFYSKYKKILDLTPKFFNKPRQMGKHAGGVVVLPGPIYNYLPVERAGDGLVTAYPESGQTATLDAVGAIKLDLLGISVLDNLKETINLIDEDIYLIEEDGIQKIVPKSYLLGKDVVI